MVRCQYKSDQRHNWWHDADLMMLQMNRGHRWYEDDMMILWWWYEDDMMTKIKGICGEMPIQEWSMT